jgi:hypothetical protein
VVNLATPASTAAAAPYAAGSAGGVGVGATAANAAKKFGYADLLKAGGAGAADAADAMASNRGTRLDAEIAREALDQSRQRQRNENVSAATKNALHADYLGRPAAERAATPGFSPYSKPLKNLPELDPALLDAMRNEAKQTLTNNPGTSQIANDLLQPSGAEKALGYGGAAATIASEIPASVWKRIGRLIFAITVLISAGAI